MRLFAHTTESMCLVLRSSVLCQRSFVGLVCIVHMVLQLFIIPEPPFAPFPGIEALLYTVLNYNVMKV